MPWLRAAGSRGKRTCRCRPAPRAPLERRVAEAGQPLRGSDALDQPRGKHQVPDAQRWNHRLRKRAGVDHRSRAIQRIERFDRPAFETEFAVVVVLEDDGAASSRPGQERQATRKREDEIMPGVVSLPHGWGHHREGVELSVARERPGESLNDILDERLFDAPSGTASLAGMEVSVTPC
jgi:hypothetical protein